jgi:hypothetical protein
MNMNTSVFICIDLYSRTSVNMCIYTYTCTYVNQYRLMHMNTIVYIYVYVTSCVNDIKFEIISNLR